MSVTLAKAGVQIPHSDLTEKRVNEFDPWITAFAGMTGAVCTWEIALGSRQHTQAPDLEDSTPTLTLPLRGREFSFVSLCG